MYDKLDKYKFEGVHLHKYLILEYGWLWKWNKFTLCISAEYVQ